MFLKKFPVFSLFNREIAAPAPETGSLETPCTTTPSRAFAIDCAPGGHPLSNNRDNHFVEVPPIIGPWSEASEPVRIFSSATRAPTAGEFLHYALEDYPLRLIGLDTVVLGEDGGRMCEGRLAWFAARLAEAPERPTLVFMHHPPIETGQPFIDRLNCRGGEAFGRIVADNPQIQAIVCGHVHRPIHLMWCGTIVITAPSTCYQFPLEMRPEVDIRPLAEPPACWIYLWRENGLLWHLSYIL